MTDQEKLKQFVNKQISLAAYESVLTTLEAVEKGGLEIIPLLRRSTEAELMLLKEET